MTLEPTRNRLLDTLPRAEYDQLAPTLELVSLDLGRILYEPPEQLQYVYFPTDSIISFLAELSDGSSVEVGLAGNEGLAGVEVILGVLRASKVATVQAAGHALRVTPGKLKEVFDQGGQLHHSLLRYTHALMMQISVASLCNVRHTTDRRLARWVLMYHDRLDRDEFYMTHEFMANMLGIRRAGVSEVAKRLQDDGLVIYNRGNFRILDRAGLEDKACECYRVIREEFEQPYI